MVIAGMKVNNLKGKTRAVCLFPDYELRAGSCELRTTSFVHIVISDGLGYTLACCAPDWAGGFF
jgi:hypothetical protein